MAVSGIGLSASVLVGVGSPNDAKYGPFADVATANSEIGSTLRYKGLTVGILVGGAVVEYWYEAGITDSDLVVKSGGGGTWGSITGTLSDQTDLQTALDGKVDENAAITGATKTKITYDSKGLVTAGADLEASDLPTGIDATKLADGSVTNTELQYINSVTSNVQTQLDAKISFYNGSTYDVTALAALTEAEYDAIVTKSETTLYFII